MLLFCCRCVGRSHCVSWMLIWPSSSSAAPYSRSPPHHNRFTALFPGPPGWASARRELLDLWCKGRLTEADTQTNGDLAALVLLDMSAAFDTVDHSIWLRHLHLTFGIDDTAHGWFQSYLSRTPRPQQVVGHLSGQRRAPRIRFRANLVRHVHRRSADGDTILPGNLLSIETYIQINENRLPCVLRVRGPVCTMCTLGGLLTIQLIYAF